MSTKAKAVKKDIEQEPQKVDELSTADPRSVEVLSKQDSVVADLVKETPALEDTDAVVTSLRERQVPNILDLPEECKPLYKVKYRFRWLAKDKNLESKLRTGIWMLCTRNNSPYIKPHRFKSHGAIEQGGMLLAFCSEEAGKLREQAPAKRSADLVKHYTEDLAKQGDPKLGGFYAPDPDEGESDEGLEMD
jgi:hypothetical protein